MTAYFIFKPISYFHNAKDTHVVEVPTMCTTEREFFSKIKTSLDIPDYFGDNWDAFFDILCDLSWVHQYYVVLFHFNLPFVDNVKNSTYLDVLIDAIRVWDQDEGGTSFWELLTQP